VNIFIYPSISYELNRG